jgi:hypothetical protein
VTENVEPPKHAWQNDGRGWFSCACGKWQVSERDLSTDPDRASTFGYRKWELHVKEAEAAPAFEGHQHPEDGRLWDNCKACQIATRTKPLEVVCPECGAGVGVWCYGADSDLQRLPHPSRWRAILRDGPSTLPLTAYAGLVPRKAGEFHHHFEHVQSTCVFCGGRVGEPCRGPQADEWDARMQARRDLKDRIFHAAYGVSEEGHRYAADEMAKFNAETLALFPDRFRVPTKEELLAQEEFARRFDPAREALLRSVPGGEALDYEITRGSDPAPRSYDVMPAAAITPHEQGLKDYLAGLEQAGGRRVPCGEAHPEHDGFHPEGHPVPTAEKHRALQEAAWDEGHAMGGRSPFFQTPNPYRKAD